MLLERIIEVTRPLKGLIPLTHKSWQNWFVVTLWII